MRVEMCCVMRMLMRAIGAAIVLACAVPSAATAQAFDLVIRGGTVVDGTGAPRRRADVGIAGDRIVAVAPSLAPGSAPVIDATGLVVAPGFIDNHAHLVTLEAHPLAENFIRQGITTIMASLHSQDEPWPLDDYAARVTMAPNVALFAGHTWIRKRVMGLANRAPTAAELAWMRALVDSSMRQGAFGLATGLEYVPASFATTDEVVALATGAAQFGRTRKSLARIDAANATGVRVAHDLYPYTAFSTYSDLMFPAWALADGAAAFARRLDDPATRARLVAEMVKMFPEQAGKDPESIQFREMPNAVALQGRTLADYLRTRGEPTTIAGAVEALIRLQRDGGFVGIFHAMDEADVARVMRHPLAMFETDGDLTERNAGFPHPRSLGSFPRILGRYVRERRVLTLEQAVHKMTAQPAAWWGLADRGRIATGVRADLVLFDARRVGDAGSYADPHHDPTGIRCVLVNGRIVLAAGAMTGEKPGEFLRRPERERQAPQR